MHLTVNGIRLHYTAAGTQGTPLVLLHGGGNDLTVWDQVSPALARSHRVYAFDLRGFGASDRPGAYSFELMRDDVIAAVDQLGLDRFAVVGHSMGGTVAWLIAQRTPERVSHLVIVDTPLPKEARAVELGPRPAPEPPYDWDALVQIMQQVEAPDPAWWSGMSEITARTLILAGGAPSHVPQEPLREAAAIVPDARLVEIPVGHNVHREAPDRFLDEVLRFLHPRPAIVRPEDVDRAVGLALETLSQAPDDGWDRPAGTLDWTCWETAEHLCDDLLFYAAQIAPRRPPTETHVPFGWQRTRDGGPANAISVERAAGLSGLLMVLDSCGGLLVSAVTTAPPSVRAHHAYGMSDPEGFAAMGIVETLVHMHDLAGGLGLVWEPPADLCERALLRLFPDAPRTTAPWLTLLWATGRGDLPGRDRLTEWRWTGAPRV